MSQLTQTIKPFKLSIGPRTYIGVAAAFAVAAVLVAIVLMSSVTQIRTAEGSNAANVVDGWMPSVSTANAARIDQQAQSATDGWMPALTSALKARSDHLAREVTDGWAGHFLK